MLMGTCPSMRCDATIWPVGLRMKIVIGMLALVAISMHLSMILRAVSALISFLINVFFAAASERTNLLMSCAEAAPAAIVSAAVATSNLRNVVFTFTLLPLNISEPGCGPLAFQFIPARLSSGKTPGCPDWPAARGGVSILRAAPGEVESYVGAQ